MRKLVLVGGGPAHIEVLRQFALQQPQGVRPTAVLESPVSLYSGRLIWTAGARAVPALSGSDLPRDARGFALVEATLQVHPHADLFAAGDCATLRGSPATPKAGVYAVRQGPILAFNLRAFLEGRPLRRYRPQADFLTLVNLGDGSAAGGKWGFACERRAHHRGHIAYADPHSAARPVAHVRQHAGWGWGLSADPRRTDDLRRRSGRQDRDSSSS